MKLRSRGLGRKELVMDFRRYDVRREGDEVLITGTITEPVTWDFSIRLEQDDFPGLIRVARSRAVISLFFSWLGGLLRRKYRKEEEVSRAEATREAGRNRRSDREERRRKIEEARRRLQTAGAEEPGERGRAERAAVPARSGSELAGRGASGLGIQAARRSGGGAAAGRESKWALSRVGAIPVSGDGASVSPEPASKGQEVPSVGEEAAASASSGGWKVRRPGALPKVS